jgi:hypothetical protein
MRAMSLGATAARTKWILGAAVALLVVLLTVPWLREAIRFGSMGLSEWLAARSTP